MSAADDLQQLCLPLSEAWVLSICSICQCTSAPCSWSGFSIRCSSLQLKHCRPASTGPCTGACFQPVLALALQVHNEQGSKRVIVTKNLPGERWLQILVAAGCRVEVSQHPDIILDNATVRKLIGDKCDGVIGQLTEVRRGRAQFDVSYYTSSEIQPGQFGQPVVAGSCGRCRCKPCQCQLHCSSELSSNRWCTGSADTASWRLVQTVCWSQILAQSLFHVAMNCSPERHEADDDNAMA